MLAYFPVGISNTVLTYHNYCTIRAVREQNCTIRAVDNCDTSRQCCKYQQESTLTLYLIWILGFGYCDAFSCKNTTLHTALRDATCLPVKETFLPNRLLLNCVHFSRFLVASRYYKINALWNCSICFLSVAIRFSVDLWKRLEISYCHHKSLDLLCDSFSHK